MKNTEVDFLIKEKMQQTIKSAKQIKGEISLLGDEFLSHLCLVLASLSEGQSKIENLSSSFLVNQTIDCLKKLGVEIEIEENQAVVSGVGLDGLKLPEDELFFGDSESTLFLLAPILANLSGQSCLWGNFNLCEKFFNSSQKLFDKLGIFLTLIPGEREGKILIEGAEFKKIEQKLSNDFLFNNSLLLLSLFADESKFGLNEDDYLSLNLYKSFGAKIEEETEKIEETEEYRFLRRRKKADKPKTWIRVKGRENLLAQNIFLPNDSFLSSLFLVLALLLKKSQITLKNVYLNESFSEFLQIIKRMGGNAQIVRNEKKGHFRSVDIMVESSSFKGRKIDGSKFSENPHLLLLLALLGAKAEDTTLIRNTEFLREGSIDRLKILAENLRKMNLKVGELQDGLVIEGKKELEGAEFDCGDDSYLSLVFSVAGLLAQGKSTISNSEVGSKHFPKFFEVIEEVCVYRK
jgi:3-phosphoshikimate 1-carboxyvinyltransferase